MRIGYEGEFNGDVTSHSGNFKFVLPLGGHAAPPPPPPPLPASAAAASGGRAAGSAASRRLRRRLRRRSNAASAASKTTRAGAPTLPPGRTSQRSPARSLWVGKCGTIGCPDTQARSRLEGGPIVVQPLRSWDVLRISDFLRCSA